MFNFVTPEQYLKLQENNLGRSHTLKELRIMANNKRLCDVCDQPVWKLGDTGLCFTCTTGEADDSDDYELIP